MKLINKKGFTLVELLAVIAILALLITVAVPSALTISTKIKERMYQTKKDMIISAAKLYGQNNSVDVAGTEDACESGIKEGIVTVKLLVENGYVKKDKDASEGNFVENPVNGDKMDDFEICIYKKNNRVYAEPVGNDWN